MKCIEKKHCNLYYILALDQKENPMPPEKRNQLEEMMKALFHARDS